MQTLSELHGLLKSRGLERLVPRANELVAPSIRLLLEPWPSGNSALSPFSGFYPNDQTPVGCSKVGGLPDLPLDFVWPESQTCALPFLAQLRLEEVSSHDLDGDLPNQGLLTVFYDHDAHLEGAETQNVCRVFHLESDSQLERRLFPKNIRRFEVGSGINPDLYPELHPDLPFIEPLKVQFRRELDVADDDALEFEAVAQALELSEAERVLWWQLSLDWSDQNVKEAYREVAKRRLGYQEHPHHQLLGLPYCGNFDGRAEVTGDNWEEEAAQWRLLLQLSSDDGLNWGDAGNVSFFIRNDALRSRNFEDVRVSYDG